VSTELVLLAVLMFAVTYPSRGLGLLTPGMERLPRVALDYLQLVGPAVLVAIAAVEVMVVVDAAGQSTFRIGIEWLAVLACMAITAWRRNLLLGLVVAVALVAGARALGIATLPI
jgi:branched-subunit amino acid transport protein